MVVRKLGIFLAVLVSAVGLFGVSTAHAQNVPVPVTVCVVAGGVTFSAPTDSSLPPDAGGPPSTPHPVNYTFGSVLLACAGGLSGVCTASSTGATFGTSPTSGFSGTFGVGGCVSQQNCGGSVGGPAVPPPPGASFSFTVGPVIIGSLNNVTCSPINVALGVSVGGVNNGSGAVALVAAPDPTAGNNCFGLIGSNTIVPAAPTGLQYCGIIVAGAAVIVG